MRLSKLLCATFFTGCSLAMFTACSSDDSIIGENDNSTASGKHTVAMKLVGGCNGFDTPATRAGETTYVWPNKAKLYLRFTTSNGIVQGNAVYDSINNAWQVNYFGSLPSTTSSTCSAVYFENPTSVTSTSVNLNANTEIYEDASGAYAFDGDTLSLTATLNPKTSRIRFKGESGTSIRVLGITRYATYNTETNLYTTTKDFLSTSVPANSSYTPYIYGNFSDTSNPSISVVIADSAAYTLECSKNMFQTGQSGFMDIPTVENRNGWATGVIVKVKNVEFKMMPVQGGTNSTITTYVSSFLMGETEVTRAQYAILMSGFGGTQSVTMPINNVRGDSIDAFVTKLRTTTGIGFNLPSQREWQYAFKGGNKSHNYIYSGGYSVDDVAWYSGNSNGSVHAVKQKLPNELGLYDMSGNVSEKVNGYYYYFGGNFSTTSSYLYYNGYNSYSYYAYDTFLGFRLCINY